MFDYLIGTALIRAIFGDAAFSRETFQKRLGLVSFVLLSLFATGAGFYQSHRLDRELAELATEGVSGQGTIVDKKDSWRNNNAYYDFVVEHVTADQARHRATLSTNSADYNAARIGGAVPIVYVRSNPDTFYLASDKPTAAKRDVYQIMLIGGLAALSISLAASAFLWSSGQGGGAAPAGPTPPQTPKAPSARAGAGLDTRAEFGRRR